jgi:ATP-dependent helicase/nuclease subunit A
MARRSGAAIAVLVRARSHLAALVAAIRRHPAGWRHTAVEIEPLAGRQAVQDLISLTRALHHRGDRLHWLAILRAPWCGLTAGRPARAGGRRPRRDDLVAARR